MSYILDPNIQNNGIFSGNCYVFDSTGGFEVERGFPEIKLRTQSPISQYDVTDAVQIKFNVRVFNNKIGVIKDEFNAKTVHVCYDVSNDKLPIDSITINSNEFLQGVNTSNIISMGKLSTLYSDFNYTVLKYFGAPYGFSTVFAGEELYNVNGGVFDASAFINIINGNTFDIAGSYVTDLSGFFKISDLNKHLRFVNGTNVFGNRPPEGNFGLTEGFIAGDLIFIANGISITLKVDIEAEPYTPINNVGPVNLASINNTLNFTDPQANVHKTTTATINNITQKYSVPILIILSNEDTFNFSNFGHSWRDVTTSFNAAVNWLAVSLSSNGQFQSAIEEFGDIYISSNFGVSWTKVYNIGTAMSNSIAMSATGQYQTASNGAEIFISNDYGVTWTKVYSFGSSKIFVCISLNGQYQTIISCGDTMYRSTNYGLTWTQFDDMDSDLYNSLEMFPTGGVAMSYDGRYQTIVSENIYLSDDYGITWTTHSPYETANPNGTGAIGGTYEEFNCFDPETGDCCIDEYGENEVTDPNVDPNAPVYVDEWGDRNWQGVAMSSEGKYQTAIESTGEIYISSDFGASWYKVVSSLLQNKQWQAVAVSANGKYQTALEKDGDIYVSTTNGSIWSAVTDTIVQNRNWQCLAISANAQYQTVAEYGGSIYISQLV